MSIQISELPVGSLIKDNNTTYYGEPIVWQILEHNHEGDPEGTTTIQTNKIITFKPFDAIETKSEWFTGNNISDNDLKAIAYNYNNTLVVVGNNGANYYSTDGINWAAGTGIDTTQRLKDVICNGDLFITVGAGGVNYHSTDGINWTSGNTIDNFTPNRIAYGNNTFVVVGNTESYYSTNGTDWTRISLGGISLGANDITYGNGIFVATSYSGTRGRTYYSTDGIDWDNGEPVENVTFKWITYGNGVFVASGKDSDNKSVLYYSTNGATWTICTGSFLSAMDLTYDRGKFVAINGLGRSIQSIDGINWMPGASISSTNISGAMCRIAYGNGSFVAIDNKKIHYNDFEDYGNAQYTYSNIRQWLNSDDVANEWFTPQTETDVSPDETNVYMNKYADENGFLYNFGNEFKTAIVESDRQYDEYTDSEHHTRKTLTDKVFLLSSKENNLNSYNVDSYESTEGCEYEYYLSKSGTELLRFPTTEAVENDDENHSVIAPYATVSSYYTASEIRTYETLLMPGSSGVVVSVQVAPAYYSYGVAPVTCINCTYSVEDEPDEDGVYSIDWSVPPQPTPETFVKYKRYIQQNGEKVLTSLWTHADSVEVDSNTTLTECIADINDRISEIPKFDIQVVDELPTENISTTTIYLVRNQEQSGTNLYDEYIYVDDEWKFLGSADISLDDYYTKVQTDALLNEKLSSTVGIPNDYNETVSYSVGDYCYYPPRIESQYGLVYRCTGSTTGSWDSTKWTATTVMGEIENGSRKMCDANGSDVNVGDVNTPVYFDDGVPTETQINIPLADPSKKPTTWTAGGNVGASNFYTIAYGNGAFVAVGNRGVNYYSKDNGTTWTAGGNAGSSRLVGVAYGNGTFVAVSNSGTSGITYYSKDNGTNWTAGGSVSGILMGITYGNGTFVAVGTSGANYHSTDGSTWTAGTTAGSSDLYGVTYGNDTFVAVGYNNATYYSKDNGTTWTAGTGASGTLSSVAYGNGTFVAVGYDGANYHSSDGSTWTAGGNAGSSRLVGVTYGNGAFVAVGTSGANYHSTDGSTWTAGSSVSRTLKGITYGNGAFVAVGYDGANYYSNITTNAQLSNLGQILNDIAHYNEIR